MATYPHEKILTDYATGKMDVEMAMGHSLQHIDQLYAAQTAANADRQALWKQVNALEMTIGGLQDDLTALKRMVSLLKTEFDRLIARAKKSPRKQGAQDSPQSS